MFTISKEFHFSASHRLEGLSEDHPCSRHHGHNYKVTLELSSEQLDITGFVVDFNDLKACKEYIDQYIDHRHLNVVFDFNPTAENLARHFYKYFKTYWRQVSKVRVSETEKTWAEYAE